MDLEVLKSKVKSVPDFPEQGITFYDITPVLEDKQSFQFLVDKLAGIAGTSEVDKVVGIDARGFILASALAYKLKKGLVIVRKKGKLPCETVSKAYSLEYAADTLEMHKTSINKGDRVLIVDDVLATGGTMASVIEIVKTLGGIVSSILFFIELDNLKGREKLGSENIKSLIHF